MAETHQIIRDFLAQFFGDHRLGDDEDIFATGFVNSLFVMQLVLFVENEFSLTIADEDLEMANFRTVSAIEAFVERKRSIAVGS